MTTKILTSYYGGLTHEFKAHDSKRKVRSRGVERVRGFTAKCGTTITHGLDEVIDQSTIQEWQGKDFLCPRCFPAPSSEAGVKP